MQLLSGLTHNRCILLTQSFIQISSIVILNVILRLLHIFKSLNVSQARLLEFSSLHIDFFGACEVFGLVCLVLGSWLGCVLDRGVR